MKIFNDKAQAGGLITFILGIFVLGFFYVAFGAIMQQIWTTNNAIIADPTFEYSQNHWNAMDMIFKYWWSLPIFFVILLAIWGIKNALTKEPTEI